MSYAILFYGLTKRSVRQFIRYGFDTFMQTFSLVIVFALLFYGAKAVMGPAAGSGTTLSSIVSGYFVWMLAIFSYSTVAQGLLEEATTGTLEQLAMSPFGLRSVIVLQFISGLLVQFVLLVTLFVAMMAVSGKWLHIDVPTLVPLIAMTVTGVFGIGLISGGAALVFKRVQALMQLLQFGFVALVAAPIDRLPWFKYLPMAWGNVLIRRTMVGGQSLSDIPFTDVAFLFVNGVAWLALGLFVFGRFERVARERALLGHY